MTRRGTSFLPLSDESAQAGEMMTMWRWWGKLDVATRSEAAAVAGLHAV